MGKSEKTSPGRGFVGAMAWHNRMDGLVMIDSTDSEQWEHALAEHDMIMVSYSSRVDCEVCVDVGVHYARMAADPAYSQVCFLTIDASANPIADQYIRRKRLPFFAIFKKGLLIECNSVQNEQGILNMLHILRDYRLEF
jgi:hypothetical protein